MKDRQSGTRGGLGVKKSKDSPNERKMGDRLTNERASRRLAVSGAAERITQYEKFLRASCVQGDHSRRTQPPVDIKTKVLF